MKSQDPPRGNFKSGLSGAVLLLIWTSLTACNGPDLTPYDMKRAKEFTLSSLPPLLPDPSNNFGDSPSAAKFGKKLFFDTGLSATSGVSCASCHQPDKQFQDGLPIGFGIAEVERRTMPLRGVQWGDWFFWDGRKDSLWSQALGPLETPAEHGMTRDMVGRGVLTRYHAEYSKIFGAPPQFAKWPYRVSPLVEGQPTDDWNKLTGSIQNEINEVFANIGKALASYQRTLLPIENRVDRFFDGHLNRTVIGADDKLTPDEIAGFRLFTGKARCDNCHSGPLYSDNFFHNTGVVFADVANPDYGRGAVVQAVKDDPFSCMGKYSDATADQCSELRFMSEDPEFFEGAFKTPGLRGVSKRPPFMHAGQIKTLEAVIDHYVARPDPFFELAESDGYGNQHGEHTAAPKIELSKQEKAQLLAFLKAL